VAAPVFTTERLEYTLIILSLLFQRRWNRGRCNNNIIFITQFPITKMPKKGRGRPTSRVAPGKLFGGFDPYKKKKKTVNADPNPRSTRQSPEKQKGRLRDDIEKEAAPASVTMDTPTITKSPRTRSQSRTVPGVVDKGALLGKSTPSSGPRTPQQSTSLFSDLNSPLLLAEEHRSSKDEVKAAVHTFAESMLGSSTSTISPLLFLNYAYLAESTGNPIGFLVAMIDRPGHPQAQHLVCDLIDFVPIATSFKLAMLAAQEIGSQYQFQLRYFGGLRGNNRSDPNLKVVNQISRLFTSIFNNPEHQPVHDCVRHARSLYITVRSVPSPRSSQDDDLDETVIACVNFSVMPGHGMYVNWLATSNEEVNWRKYGKDLQFLCQFGWQEHGLATLLLKIANLSVIANMALTGQLSPTVSYNIVLQARTSQEESSAQFYLAIGFEEKGSIDSQSELDSEVFVGCGKIIEDAKHSETDYIHFIWDGGEDIVVFTNAVGELGSHPPLGQQISRFFPTMKSRNSTASFSFPFPMRRDHYVHLASQLEFYYLPFKEDVDWREFGDPVRKVCGSLSTSVMENDVLLLQEPTSWLTDIHIDVNFHW
jgi:hypothetical protein